MIFAHAPASFIVTFFTKKIWQKNLTKRQTFWIFIIGAISGAIADIDTFYYYLVAATSTHRQMITHTFFLYLVIFLTLFLIGYFKKNQFIKSGALVFILATFSHLLLDSLGSGVAWLYPFNKLLYGLLNISFLNQGFYGQNLFFINFTFEFLIILVFLSIFFCFKFKEKIKRIIFFTFSFIFFSFLVILLFILGRHLFSKNANNYYGDLDNDGIMNMEDQDMDGDNILNISDIDADNNGYDNLDDVIKTAEKMEEIFYDRTEKGYWEFLPRLGFLSSIDTVLKPYDYAGIFLGKEMKVNFQENKNGYMGSFDNYEFSDSIQNLYAFCKNKEFLLGEAEKPKKGDTIFYQKDGKISHISLFIEEPDLVIDAGLGPKVMKIKISKVEDKFGKVINIGRVLK